MSDSHTFSFDSKLCPQTNAQPWGVRNVDVLLPHGLKRNTTVQIAKGKIASIGEAPKAGDLDGTGYLLSPGLINSHTHTAMTFLRDLAHTTDDVISNLFFKTERQLNAELVEKLSYSFLLSALRSGTTCVFDHYYFSSGVAQALERLGMRGCIGETVADLGGAFPSTETWKTVRKTIEFWPYSSRITPSIAPHAIDTVSDAFGKELGTFAQKNKLPIHFHLSQRRSEFQGALNQSGRSPVRLAQERKWFGPQALAVHVLYLAEQDLSILKDSGTTIANCPSSQIIYERLAPIDSFLAKGIPVALGTDGNASSDQADLMAELKLFTLLLKDRGYRPTDLYRECFKSVTEIPAQVAGLPLGQIKEGTPADLVFIKQDLENLPLREPWTHFIFSLQSSHVKHVLIDGQWVLWDRMPVRVSEQDLRQEYLAALNRVKI